MPGASLPDGTAESSLHKARRLCFLGSVTLKLCETDPNGGGTGHRSGNRGTELLGRLVEATQWVDGRARTRSSSRVLCSPTPQGCLAGPHILATFRLESGTSELEHLLVMQSVSE